MNGRDVTITFLPLDFRIGGQSRDSCPTVGQYLTRDQTRYKEKGRSRGNDKHRHDTAGDRTGKTIR